MIPIIVTTTCEKIKDAEDIASHLLQKKLAACVQISSPIQSIYHWQGKIEKSSEYVVTIKSCRLLYNEVASAIKKKHSYEVPEIIATEILAIDPPYREWLIAELGF